MKPRPLAIALFAGLCTSASGISCAELKMGAMTTLDGPDSSDGSALDASMAEEADAAAAAEAGKLPSGPGPLGALPNGYCCTQDADCRRRHCADLGNGTKVCRDSCYSDKACERPGLAWTCDQSEDVGGVYRCKPPPSFACIPASEFTPGTKPSGTCCSATHDGTAGLECQGGICAARGDGPFTCTQGCSSDAQCPGNFFCLPGVGLCLPTNEVYTCN